MPLVASSRNRVVSPMLRKQKMNAQVRKLRAMLDAKEAAQN